MLSSRSFLIALVVVLAIFVGLNPIWRSQSMSAWEENIFWSYVPVPLLVLGLLRWERKLTLTNFLLETLKLGLVKFGITFALANTIWIFIARPVSSPTLLPTALPRSSDAPTVHAPRPPSPPSVIDPKQTGELSGVVRHARGRPAPDTLVYIESGLDHFVFSSPDHPAIIQHDGSSFSPTFSLVQTYRELEFASYDGLLHTGALMDRHGRSVMNVALPPHSKRVVMFSQNHGLLMLQCRVHRQEPTSHLLVTSHPFTALTDADGHFSFTEVPATTVVLRAWTPKAATQRLSVKIRPGETHRFDLALQH